MSAFSAVFFLATGAALLVFAIHPALVETTNRAFREFMFLAFQEDVNSWSINEELSLPVRLSMAVIGAVLIFASGAVMA